MVLWQLISAVSIVKQVCAILRRCLFHLFAILSGLALSSTRWSSWWLSLHRYVYYGFVFPRFTLYTFCAFCVIFIALAPFLHLKVLCTIIIEQWYMTIKQIEQVSHFSPTCRRTNSKNHCSSGDGNQSSMLTDQWMIPCCSFCPLSNLITASGGCISVHRKS